MRHPTIKDYREDRRRHWISPVKDRPQFLGQSSLDLRWHRFEPKVNVTKTDELYTMEVILPGFEKEQIEVMIDDDVLTIRAERNVEEGKLNEYIIREFDTDVVERKFILGHNIGHEKVTAKYHRGILTLTFKDVPAEEERMHKKVSVS